DQHVETAYDLGLGMRADYLQRGTNGFRIMHSNTGEECVGVFAGDHHRSEIIAVEQQLVRFAMTQSFSLATLPQIVGVLVALVGGCRVIDGDVAERDVVLFGKSLDGPPLTE